MIATDQNTRCASVAPATVLTWLPGSTSRATPTSPTAMPTSVTSARAVARDRAEDDDPERHDGDDERRDAGGHVPLGEGEDADAEPEQQDADDRGTADLLPRHAQGARAAAQGDVAAHEDRGGEEPRAEGEQRRHRLDGDAIAR